MWKGPKTINLPSTLHDLPTINAIQKTNAFCIRSSVWLTSHKNQSLEPCASKQFDKMLQKDGTIQDSFLSRALYLVRGSSTEHNYNTVVALHSLALKIGALADICVASSFLTMYAKARDLGSSWCLFDEITCKDVICWNSMISACVYGRCYEAAVTLFRQMKKDVKEFDSTTLLIVLSALSRLNWVEQGRVLHAISLKGPVDSNCFLSNALIDMYAKCSDLSSAESIFVRNKFKDATTWNSMMVGYLRNGQPDKSLRYFRKMSFSGVRADAMSLSCVISACSCLGELGFGESVHGWGIKFGYDEQLHLSVANALISLYSQCANICAAQKVFQRLIRKDVVSWNSMIHGFAMAGKVVEPIDLLHQMQLTEAFKPDTVTMVSVLPLCAEFCLLQQGRSIHGFSIRRNFLLDLSVTNSLLDMYFKCDSLRNADVLFKAMADKDLISWNTMIGGYSQNGYISEPRVLFRDLLHSGLQCSLSTLLAVITSCHYPEDMYFGKSIHCWMLKSGFSHNISALNALMSMYLNCRNMEASLSLFQSVSVEADEVSWNSIIVGCTQNGYYREALEAFNQMQWSSVVNPDSITLVSVLSACGTLELVFYGWSIHGLAVKTLMESDLRVRNALLTMYCKCRDVQSAESLFDTTHYRNLYSWNCMISGFAQNKDGRRALELYHHMKFEPNEITIVSILSACTLLGSLRHGREINGYVLHLGHNQNAFIAAALVDMYSKCGRLDVAVRIFQNSVEKSVACWNSMISAFGTHGHGEKAIELFSEMCKLGVVPTKSTFISLLSACSHSGLVDEGLQHYNRMHEEFCVVPTTEHHVCMVDMLGRAGRLLEAYEFIKQIPTQPAAGVWGALLSACREHGNLEMGKSVAENLFYLEPENVGYYISLSNMFAAAEKWSCAVHVRRLMRDRGLKKPPGCSLLDICSG